MTHIRLTTETENVLIFLRVVSSVILVVFAYRNYDFLFSSTIGNMIILPYVGYQS